MNGRREQRATATDRHAGRVEGSQAAAGGAIGAGERSTAIGAPELDTDYERQLADFIEEFAELMQSRGLPRMAGRIFARLLVCEPPEQTAAQLSDALGASRGTVSDMTRLLIEAGLVQRLGRAGSREAFYRVAPDTPTLFLRAAVEPLRRRRIAAEHGLEILRDRPEQVSARLRELRDVYLFFEQRYPLMLEEWQSRPTGGAR